ncbi:ABC transporter ATP-binding protein NatA [bacterium HR17]|uniref:ABC transporter ATP-binding protein NatA n=1 Tax=Candidatus Fervidibacter japonicus TaxID=2035412 RepID=A0A2H5XAC4_9BACT|nr:ABC transporter ATP-binding protein NatA [bacterium HR17]
MDVCVQVVELCKYYTVHEREPGLWNALRSLLRRRYRLVKAVDGISFTIGRGEVVGFLGPNGAGKTTTLKVLAGLLCPTGGTVRVLGYDPFQRHPDFLRRITLVMGQRSQLVWDLPPMETFLLNKAIYDLSDADFRDALDELVELLDLAPLLSKPVRQLSLGERMRCELAAALLHRPQVLFLDEPTLGLDVLAQAQIRRFVHEYNRRRQATVLLTSHYMDDVLALCQRVMVINHGRLIYDGDLTALLHRYGQKKVLQVVLDDSVPVSVLERWGEVVACHDRRVTLRVPREATSAVAAELLAAVPVRDLTIEEPPIEEIIAALFNTPAQLTGISCTAVSVGNGA